MFFGGFLDTEAKAMAELARQSLQCHPNLPILVLKPLSGLGGKAVSCLVLLPHGGR